MDWDNDHIELYYDAFEDYLYEDDCPEDEEEEENDETAQFFDVPREYLPVQRAIRNFRRTQ